MESTKYYGKATAVTKTQRSIEETNKNCSSSVVAWMDHFATASRFNMRLFFRCRYDCIAVYCNHVKAFISLASSIRALSICLSLSLPSYFKRSCSPNGTISIRIFIRIINSVRCCFNTIFVCVPLSSCSLNCVCVFGRAVVTRIAI